MLSSITKPMEHRPESFILWHATTMCLAANASDPHDHLISGICSTCFSSFSTSVGGEFFACEARDTDSEINYLLVCFKDRWLTSPSDLADLNPLKLSAVHGDIINSCASFLLSLVACAIEEKKKVVLTGHALGGSCAALLAHRFISRYGPHGYDEGQLTCVTFGSPILSAATVVSEIGRHCFHYLHGQDPVPIAYSALADVYPELSRWAELSSKTAPESYEGSSVDSASEDDDSVDSSSTSAFGQTCGAFYHVHPHHPQAPKDLQPLTANQVKNYFCAHTLDAFDPSRITDHAMENYKNTLWSASALPIPPPSPFKPPPPPRQLPPLCPVPTVRSCLVKGDAVIVTGAGLAYCHCLRLGPERLPLSGKFVSSDARAVFTLEALGVDDVHQLQTTLANHSYNKMTTELSLTTMFGRACPACHVHVQLARAEDFLSPGKVLACVLPLSTLLLRSDADGDDPVQSTLTSMLEHCRSLADSVPIEFAFRSLESDSSDKDQHLLRAFVNRLTTVRIDWQTVCSRVMISILRNAVSNLQRGRLPLLREALRCELFCTRNSSIAVAHLLDGHLSLAVGPTASKDEYWRLICDPEHGVACSVDLHYPHDPDTILGYFGLPGSNASYVRGCNVKILSHTSGPVTVTNIEITYAAFALVRKFKHFSFQWGDAELPCEIPFTALVDEVRKAITDKEHLRGTNCRAPCIYLCDPAGSRHARTGLFAFCLAQRLAYKIGIHTTEDQIVTDLAAAWPCPASSRFTLNELHFAFACRCGLDNPRNLRTACRKLQHTLSPESDSLTEATQVLKSHLHQMENHSVSVYRDAICGQSVTMEVWASDSATPRYAPFFDLFPKLVPSDALNAMATLEETQFLVNQANESVAKARYLTIMLEDTMSFGKKILETPREKDLRFGLKWALAAAQSMALLPTATAKAAAAVVQRKSKHIVEVEAVFASFWHHAYYQQFHMSTYQDVVDQISSRLGYLPAPGSGLIEKEAFIRDLLPDQIRSYALRQLIDEKRQVFTHPRLTQFLHGRSCGLMIFFLKTIYHCSHLRRLRKQITLVTIAGEKNAGKTTLNKAIFGEDVVTAPTGTGDEDTTVLPGAYALPGQSNVLYSDLPGCTDATTAEMSDMFLTLGDITVFVVRQSIAPNPRTGDVLYSTIAKVLAMKGPRLICINQSDMLLKKGGGKTPYDPVAKLRRECEKWAGSALFGNHLQGQAEDLHSPKWECERGEQAGAIIASVKTADSALSIWMTSFEPLVAEEISQSLLFGAARVKAWVQEAIHAAEKARAEEL